MIYNILVNPEILKPCLMIATLVSVHGIQFVHFIFGEADRAKLGEAKAKAEDDQKSKDLRLWTNQEH
jgi:hypothetical protein